VPEPPTAETPTPDTPVSETPPTDEQTPEAPAEETPAIETPVTEPPPPAPVEVEKKAPSGPVTYVWGTGRRKAAIARVRIRPGEGKFLVNKREVDNFFCLAKDLQAVRQPLTVTNTAKTYDVFVNVTGGGISGQAGAVVLGLARALLKANRDYEPKLREFNLLTRDPRKVERKKYGQRGARRRFQFSKR
jgi:small subunit ribosomal protein S9